MHFKVISPDLPICSLLLYSEISSGCSQRYGGDVWGSSWKESCVSLGNSERAFALTEMPQACTTWGYFLLIFESRLWSLLPSPHLWHLLPSFLLPPLGFFLLLNKLNWFYVCNSFLSKRVWRWPRKELLSSKARSWSKQCTKAKWEPRQYCLSSHRIRVLCWRNSKAHQLHYAGSCWSGIFSLVTPAKFKRSCRKIKVICIKYQIVYCREECESIYRMKCHCLNVFIAISYIRLSLQY